MRLLRCNIINFGCITDFSCNFSEGINEQLLPNGSGKSTFAAFLCAMFYGLDSSSRKSIALNDRKHYLPWNGNVCGGAVEFLSDKIVYRLERTFGPKERDDTTFLYDMSTRTVSNDFGINPGPKLFGIDKDGFMKTLYIPQLRVSFSANESLSSRLIQLTHEAEDISRYEKAEKAIDKACHTYVKTGHRGMIDQTEATISQLDRQLSETSYALREYTGLSEQLQELESESASTSDLLQKTRRQIEIASLAEIKQIYSDYGKRLADKEEGLLRLEEKLRDTIPDSREIDDYLIYCRDLNKLEIQIQEQKLKAAESIDYSFLSNLFENTGTIAGNNPHEDFAGSEQHFFTDSQLSRLAENPFYRSQAILYQGTSERLSDAVEEADLPPVSMEQIKHLENTYYQIISDHQALELKKSKLPLYTERIAQEERKQMEDHDRIKECEKETEDCRLLFRPAILTAMGILVFCLLLLLNRHPLLSASLFILGIVAEAVYCYLNIFRIQAITSSEIRILKENIQDTRQVISELEKNCTLLNAQISDAVSSLNTLEQGFLNKLNASKIYPYYVSQIPADLPVHLNSLSFQWTDREHRMENQKNIRKSHLDFYDSLLRKKNSYRRRIQVLRSDQEKSENLKQALLEYLSFYYPELKQTDLDSTVLSSVFIEKLQELRNTAFLYRRNLSEQKELQDEYRSFLKKHPELNETPPGAEAPLSADTSPRADASPHADTSPRADTSPSADSSLPFDDQSDEDFCGYGSITKTATAWETDLRFLKQKELSLTSSLSETEKKISELTVRKHYLADQIDQYASIREKRDHLSGKVKEAKEHYRLLRLSSEFLTKARNDFTEGYLKSVESHIMEYADFLDSDLMKKVSVNSDFSVLLEDQGLLRGLEWYSQGLQDLFAFCCRMAIIQDLFPNEKPLLILDDTFVNLDESSFSLISGLLRKISKDFQIIYLTCHNSRSLSQDDRKPGD